MKVRNMLVQSLSIGALTAAFATSAMAIDSVAHQRDAAPYGSLAAATAANRVIRLAPDAAYLNVQRRETVTIQKGDKAFTWNFYTVQPGGVIELAKIAPPDFGAGRTLVYVAPGPDDLRQD